jgi:hypothetical protein
MDVTSVIMKLIAVSRPYQPVFRAIVLVFDLFISALIQREWVYFPLRARQMIRAYFPRISLLYWITAFCRFVANSHWIIPDSSIFAIWLDHAGLRMMGFRYEMVNC